MLTKRIIPCLDVKEGCVVKGTCFENLQTAGDPVAMAMAYEEQGADELVLLDIAATCEGRATFRELVAQVAKKLSIPLTVGGGIRSLSDISCLLNVGVDKVSLNSAAIATPQLIKHASEMFGSQCIVLAIDAKRCGPGWEVFSRSGTLKTGLDVLDWALLGEHLGAGELLITSIDCDGMQKGYDLELIRTLGSLLTIPIIASGGVGCWEDIREVFLEGDADAALAASLFHIHQCLIGDLKQKLAMANIEVRL